MKLDRETYNLFFEEYVGQIVGTGSQIPEKDVNGFLDRLHEKVQKGAEEYGESSYSNSTEQMIKEITEEALDIPGWAGILYAQMRLNGASKRDLDAVIAIGILGVAAYMQTTFFEKINKGENYGG